MIYSSAYNDNIQITFVTSSKNLAQFPLPKNNPVLDFRIKGAVGQEV
jgi:hypothetical protein